MDDLPHVSEKGFRSYLPDDYLEVLENLNPTPGLIWRGMDARLSGMKFRLHWNDPVTKGLSSVELSLLATIDSSPLTAGLEYDVENGTVQTTGILNQEVSFALYNIHAAYMRQVRLFSEEKKQKEQGRKF